MVPLPSSSGLTMLQRAPTPSGLTSSLIRSDWKKQTLTFPGLASLRQWAPWTGPRDGFTKDQELHLLVDNLCTGTSSRKSTQSSGNTLRPSKPSWRPSALTSKARMVIGEKSRRVSTEMWSLSDLRLSDLLQR